MRYDSVRGQFQPQVQPPVAFAHGLDPIDKIGSIGSDLAQFGKLLPDHAQVVLDLAVGLPVFLPSGDYLFGQGKAGGWGHAGERGAEAGGGQH